MPIYEYSCRKCNDLFSVIHSMNASGNNIKCPRCGSDDVKKKISSFSFGSLGGSSASFSPHGRSGGFGGG